MERGCSGGMLLPVRVEKKILIHEIQTGSLLVLEFYRYVLQHYFNNIFNKATMFSFATNQHK